MFSIQQLKTLEALVNRIIPPDEYPGGWDAGVGDYLFKQFEGDLQHLLPNYQQWLDALDVESQTVHNATFAELNSEVQDSLLVQIEQGQTASSWPTSLDPGAFFLVIAEHCAEGFYADPGNGGNKDMIAWKMIGFEVTE